MLEAIILFHYLLHVGEINKISFEPVFDSINNSFSRSNENHTVGVPYLF